MRVGRWWRHGRAETSTNARFRDGGRWGWPENGQNPKLSAFALNFGVGWRRRHGRAETSMNARFGVRGQWGCICAQFWGWVVAAAQEGRNEHECSFRGRGTVAAARESSKPQNQAHTCSISGLGGGGHRRRAVRTPKRAQILVSGVVAGRGRAEP